MSTSLIDQPASGGVGLLSINKAVFNSKMERDASEKVQQSFLEALTENSPHVLKEEDLAVYVHPLVRKSSAKLSEKSLEMCTESLGSETGSDDIMEEEAMINSSSVHATKAKVVTKTKRETNFPPPLTSINGSVCMKARREHGRLVMNAVVVTEASNSLFHAERVDGRLTLRFKKADSEKGDGVEGEKNETEDEVETEEHGGKEKETEHSVFWCQDLDDKDEKAEGSFGIDDNISRLLRCNETGEERGGKGHLWNMETCCVAT